jgi:hypothetical protein
MFFGTSTRASARSAWCVHRAISRACSVIVLSRGSRLWGAAPRFFASPANSPRSRAGLGRALLWSLAQTAMDLGPLDSPELTGVQCPCLHLGLVGLAPPAPRPR